MSNHDRDPILLTRPLTTTLATKTAMLRDWGSWDAAFNDVTARVRARLVDVIHAADTHVCVPMQGSGTFSVEAAVNTLVPRDGHVLVLINGAYGKRLARLTTMMGRKTTTFETADDVPTTADDVERMLAKDPSITHVGLIHCETSTGIENPLQEIAAVVARHGRRLIVDAMSSFGALPIDARTTPFDALVAASGKCVEGPPGMGFVFVRKDVLERCAGNSHVAGARPARPVDVHGKDDAVAVHAADARRRRAGRGARAVRGRGRAAGAARALHRELRDARDRHARTRLPRVPARRDPGADHRDVPRARRSRGTRSATSTTAFATRASSCIRASSRRSRRSASAASARSDPRKCGTPSTRCGTRWPRWASGRSSTSSARAAA